MATPPSRSSGSSMRCFRVKPELCAAASGRGTLNRAKRRDHTCTCIDAVRCKDEYWRRCQRCDEGSPDGMVISTLGSSLPAAL